MQLKTIIKSLLKKTSLYKPLMKLKANKDLLSIYFKIKKSIRKILKEKVLKKKFAAKKNTLNSVQVISMMQTSENNLKLYVTAIRHGAEFHLDDLVLLIKYRSTPLDDTLYLYTFKPSIIESEENKLTVQFVINPDKVLVENTVIINTADLYLKLDKEYRVWCSKEVRNIIKYKNYDFIPYCTIYHNFSIIIVRKQSKVKVQHSQFSITFVLFKVDYRGGVTKVTIDLANSLANLGYEVNLVAVDLANDPNKFAVSEKVNFDYISINVYQDKNLLPSDIYSKKETVHPSFFITLQEYFVHKNYDIVYLPVYGPTIFSNILKSLPKRTKKIIGDHSSRRYKIYNDILKKNKKITFDSIIELTNDSHLFNNINQVDAIHIVNPMVKPVYEQVTNTSIIDIPNIVSGSTEKNRPFYERKNTIILIGRLTKIKNFSAAISAFSKLHILYPNWTMEIYGSGEEEGQLLSQISSYNLEKKVFLKGFSSNIQKHLQNSMIHLSISHTESFGLTMVEAMNNNVITVSTNKTIGAQYLIDDGITGFLAKTNDELAIYEILKKVIGLIEERSPLVTRVLSNASTKAQNFSADHIAKDWCMALQELDKLH